MYKYSEAGGTDSVSVTDPAQRLTTSSNYVSLTGTTPIKLRGTSDMVTEEGKIHNYRMDSKNRSPSWIMHPEEPPQVRDCTIREVTVRCRRA